MSSPYETATNDGRRMLTEWMSQKGMTPADLPCSPWDLPADCPLWKMGLSLAQVLWIVEIVARSYYDKNLGASEVTTRLEDS